MTELTSTATEIILNVSGLRDIATSARSIHHGVVWGVWGASSLAL